MFNLRIQDDLQLIISIPQQKQYNNDIIQLMLKSKSIKLNITKNDSHQNTSICHRIKDERRYETFQPVFKYQQDGQLAEIMPSLSHSNASYFQTVSLSAFERESVDSYERSMFTIRQQSSYEYQSEAGSVCLRKRPIQSYIDQFSTIKGEYNKQNLYNSNQNVKNNSIHSFSSSGRNNTDNLQGLAEKISGNATMSSLDTQKNSFAQLVPQIQDWTQRLKSFKYSCQNDQEQVEDEKMITLSQSQKSLNLNKMKMHNSGLIIRPDQKIKKNYDIIYSCSQEQLGQIVKILSKQGIMLVSKQKPSLEKTRQNRNKNQTENSRRQKRKIKIKLANKDSMKACNKQDVMR